MTGYTPEVKALVKSLKVPHDFVMDVVEYDFKNGKPPYYALRFYESHWRHLNEKERLNCVDYMTKVRAILKAYGMDSTLDPIFDVQETKWIK